MSSAMHGSEQEMARVARAKLGARPSYRVLIGGLGMGFTCRAALEVFGDDSYITVAELLPALIGYNQGVLGPLANHPLRDPRVELFEGDVREQLDTGRWDAVLIDVDNGPDAFTARGNAALYGPAGASKMAGALSPGGVLVIWSAAPSPAFEKSLSKCGLSTESRSVFARGNVQKGPRHTLVIGSAPSARAPRRPSARYRRD